MRIKKLFLAAVLAAATLTSGATAKAADIVDTAVAADGFETLVAAVKAAGLVGTLKGSGPFTVFAPTDAAFAGLGRETLDDLLKPENKGKLTKILSYHVVPGTHMATNFRSNQTYYKTVEGQAIYVQGVSGLHVANHPYRDITKYARIVQPDIVTDNGVIHAIDKVILPPDMD